MSRYRITLVPQGVIPQDLTIGIRMTPLAPPPAAPTEPSCKSVWDAWGVIVGDLPSTGDTHYVSGDVTDITVELIGVLCPGDCIEWEIRPLQYSPDPNDSWTLTPDGCTGVAMNGTWSGILGALWWAIYPTIAGQPFGETLIFTNIPDCPFPPEFSGWLADFEREDSPLGECTGSPPSTFPNSAFRLDYSPAGLTSIETCGDNLRATFTLDPPGLEADFTTQAYFTDLSSTAIGFRVSATGANDYTGITLSLSAIWEGHGTAFGDGIAIVCI